MSATNVGPQDRLRLVLRALMDEQQLKTEDLATYLGCKQSAAAMKLRGERNFSFDDAAKASTQLRFSLDELIDNTSEVAQATEAAAAVQAELKAAVEKAGAEQRQLEAALRGQLAKIPTVRRLARSTSRFAEAA